jgi:hypothetical protein
LIKQKLSHAQTVTPFRVKGEKMSIIEGLKSLGFTIMPISETRITIGKTEYVVKSVYTENNGKTMSETLFDVAQKRAFRTLEKDLKTNERQSKQNDCL